MENNIDAEKLYAKVDALMAHYAKAEKDVEDDAELSIFYQGKRKMCSEIINLITSLQHEQSSLPDNLDEAAEKYEDWVESYSQSDFPTCVSFRQAFKAGAEWMVRNGYTKEGIARPDDCEIWVNFTDTDIKDGDEVIVQIRKK